MVQRESTWKVQDLPDDPVERLVAMGFGNRELNKQFLEKHDYQLQVNSILILYAHHRLRDWVQCNVVGVV